MQTQLLPYMPLYGYGIRHAKVTAPQKQGSATNLISLGIYKKPYKYNESLFIKDARRAYGKDERLEEIYNEKIRE